MSSTRILSLPALILFLIALATLLAASLAAQDSATGAIRGTVLDATGSRIPQASIVVVNTATGTRHAATSDAEGSFTFDLLPPGDYSARVTAQGMSPQVTPQLHVDVGGAAILEFRLTIAGVQEKVTVSGAPAMVETQPSAVSTLLDERAVNDFPLNGRRFSDLALFSPGVTQDPRSLTSATNGDLSFGGIRGFQNTTLVDGLDYNNAFFAQARGRYRAPYAVLHRSRAGVPRLHQLLRRRARTLRRRRRQRRHQVRLQPRARHRVLPPPRQFLRRVRSLPGLQAAQPPAAVRRHRRRPAQAQQDFLLRRLRSAYLPLPQRRRIPRRHLEGRARRRHRTLHARRLRSQRSNPGLRRRRATHLARRRVSRRANRQHFLRQARHQSHPAPSARAEDQHHALLGSQQRFPRSRQPRHLRLHQRQWTGTGLHRNRLALPDLQPSPRAGSAISAPNSRATGSSPTATPATFW